MEARKSVLLIDDDERLLDEVGKYLEASGWRTVRLSDPRKALDTFATERPDVVMLDLVLSGTDGIELCSALRSRTNVPILIVSARAEVEDRVRGLEAGADDYILKPFQPREILARLNSVLRRGERRLPRESSPTAVRYGSLEIEVASRSVRLEGNPVSLTTTEFEILCLLVESPGKILNRNDIMDRLRGIEWSAFNRSIDILVSRLRQKLGDSAKNPRFIRTVWGEGYLFIPQRSEK